MWIAFNLFVLVMLAIDLGVFHKKAHTVSVKEALIWSAVWISLALVFNFIVYLWRGHDTALQFLTGYLIEKSLSVDNLFVFLLIFSYFNVPPLYQHKILYWGILGALVMRAILIGVGAALITRFHWVIYVFGGFLIFTGIKMFFQKEEEIHPEDNPVVKLLMRFARTTGRYHDDRFLVKIDGKMFVTPMLITLAVVEVTDLVFALDSIPAIFAVTKEPFIVYTSNVFAILGLRSLYFALAGVVDKFHYLKVGLAVVLTFVGTKMVIADIYHISIGLSLGVVGGVLALSVIASLLWPPAPAVLPPPKPQA
jgi:tellurite resistance protein TerC